MEGLDQSKQLHDALRFIVVELQGLKDFYKSDFASAVAFLKFKCIVSLDRCVLEMLEMYHFSQFPAVCLMIYSKSPRIRTRNFPCWPGLVFK